MTYADKILKEKLYKERGGLRLAARQLDPGVRIEGPVQMIGASRKVYRFSDGSVLEVFGRGTGYKIRRVWE